MIPTGIVSEYVIPQSEEIRNLKKLNASILMVDLMLQMIYHGTGSASDMLMWNIILNDWNILSLPVDILVIILQYASLFKYDEFASTIFTCKLFFQILTDKDSRGCIYNVYLDAGSWNWHTELIYVGGLFVRLTPYTLYISNWKCNTCIFLISKEDYTATDTSHMLPYNINCKYIMVDISDEHLENFEVNNILKKISNYQAEMIQIRGFSSKIWNSLVYIGPKYLIDMSMLKFKEIMK